jgi:probable aminopeptidase NPEPL1
MPTELHFRSLPLSPADADALVLVGRRDRLLAADVAAHLPGPALAVLPALLDAVSTGDEGGAASTLLPVDAGAAAATPKRLVVCVLPEACSRHNSPARPHAIAALLGKQTPNVPVVSLLLVLDTAEHAFAAGCAVARAWPVYSRKTSPAKDRAAHAAFLAPDTGVTPEALARVEHAARGIQTACRLVETPTAELTTDAFVEEARTLAHALGATLTLVRGESLRDQGFGGLWGVGKAATHPPALAVLSHTPPGAKRTVAWVGKGIVYDTGGLSLKGKTDMPGMKRDMGGAAAVFAAFGAAVRNGCADNLHAVLCLAENAIGPDAVRNDDVLTMYSGKTVEVNNTDAEGRLVLADGIAWALRHVHPDVLIDLATLTGAQLVATGKRHAAIVSNDAELEAACIVAGRTSGELVHPLPYCPEMFRAEFKSEVADMRNSVKDRMNAQSSCAAQFIADHMGDATTPWLHVDIAGPAEADNRATGYGVGLLLTLLAGA